jgi:hypothetical protein
MGEIGASQARVTGRRPERPRFGWWRSSACGLCVFAALSACSPSRLVEAVRVVADIHAGSGASSLKEATAPPRRLPVAFEIEGRPRQGDLYLPADAAARIVLVPGLTPRGRDDPRVVAFATTLARARFEVLVPDLPQMRALQVTGQDAVPIADAAFFLDTRGKEMPLGLIAVSFAVGPAVGALYEPPAAGRVDFVVTIGGYYDLEALITFVTTGYYRQTPTDPWHHQTPAAYGKWVFLLTNAQRVDDPADRQALYEMAERKLGNGDADVADLVRRLGAQGRTVHALLDNHQPERVPDLIAALPAAIRDEMAALDLKCRDLARLPVDFIVVHDRNDTIIPATQSIQFAAATAPDRAHLFLIGSLEHAVPGAPDIVDGMTMVSAVYRVLAYRDG